MKRKREPENLLCLSVWLKIFLTLDTRDDITSLSCVSKYLYEISKTKKISKHLSEHVRSIKLGHIGTIEFTCENIGKISNTYSIELKPLIEARLDLLLVDWDKEQFWVLGYPSFNHKRSPHLAYKSETTLISFTPRMLITNDFRKFKTLYKEGAFNFESYNPYG